MPFEKTCHDLKSCTELGITGRANDTPATPLRNVLALKSDSRADVKACVRLSGKQPYLVGDHVDNGENLPRDYEAGAIWQRVHPDIPRDP